jgi:hypothetical protein
VFNICNFKVILYNTFECIVPSDIRTGYDMFLAAADSEAIYPILLDNGQVTTITGILLWSNK